MKKQKLAIKMCILAIFLLPVFLLGFSLEKGENTYAVSTIDFDYSLCLDFDGNTVTYDTSGNLYARQISLHYLINAPQYIVVAYNKAGNEINRTQLKQPDGGIGSYDVTANGELTIRCYAADSNGFIMEGLYVDNYVRSDNLSPQEAFVSEMTEWKMHLNGFAVDILIGEDNGNSGINKAEIDIIYADETIKRTITSPVMNDYFVVYEECNVHMTIYDNAGNYSAYNYIFDKFDSDPPTPPSFNFVPNVEVGEATNGFARDYIVTINYGQDAKSGPNTSSMKYTLNGDLYSYVGGINLNEQRNYTITAYYQDNAGNTSEVISATILNIDRIAPSVSGIQLAVDLMKQKPYTLSMICNDSDSGINRIQVDGMNLNFIKGIYSVYTANFSSLDKALLRITVYDNVGNFQTTSIITHHFGNFEIEDLAIEYNQKFLELQSQDYSQIGWDKILSLYSELNLMLMIEDTSLNDFDNISLEIDQAILGEVEYKYTIKTLPEGVSANISSHINPLDIVGMKKGDIFTMILEAVDEDEETEAKTALASGLSGYAKSMAKLFKISFTHNDDAIDYAFGNGTKIIMAVPRGYEARYFSVINLESQELLESQQINNTVIFYVNGGGEYALVIEGTEISQEAEEIRGLNVFGKTISWWSFALSLAGVVSGAVLLFVFIRMRFKQNIPLK